MEHTRLTRRLFRVGEMPTSRIEAFSDGVFAIVVTLLIFSIQVPQIHGDAGRVLGPALLAMIPKFLSFALSFGVVCVWWVAHHQLFILLRKSDRGLLWLNSLFLFSLAALPFPTALLGDYPHERIAVVCYGAVMALAGLSFSAMRFYAFYISKLAAGGIEQNLLRRTMIKSLMNPILHLIAVLLAWVDTRMSLFLYAGIPMLFFVPTRLERSVVTVKPE